MDKVFPDVNVLGALAAADDINSPFDTCCVDFIHWSLLMLLKSHALEEVAKVEYLHSCCGRRVLLRFGRRQRCGLLQQILHAARVDSDNGTTLDMEIILNLISGIFKPEDESAGYEASLQAALSAQVRRTNYEHRGMAPQERKPLQKNPDQRTPKQSAVDFSKLMQVVFDIKAEMGCMRKAMINAGMSFITLVSWLATDKCRF